VQYNDKVLAIRDAVTRFEVEQGIDASALFIQVLTQYIVDGCSLVDIGTGNGFVLSQVLQHSDKQIQLFGVDNSKDMVSLARKNLAGNATIVEADVSNLPFDNCSFDIETAKNVTQIDAAEIFRILKEGGVFIFREYGQGKGMLEIADLFRGRIIRQREPDYYVERLLDAGFQIVKFDQYEIKRKYRSAQELVSIVKSFPFVEDFSKTDEEILLEKFAQDATITSDPFILVATKPKGRAQIEKS